MSKFLLSHFQLPPIHKDPANFHVPQLPNYHTATPIGSSCNLYVPFQWHSASVSLLCLLQYRSSTSLASRPTPYPPTLSSTWVPSCSSDAFPVYCSELQLPASLSDQSLPSRSAPTCRPTALCLRPPSLAPSLRQLSHTVPAPPSIFNFQFYLHGQIVPSSFTSGISSSGYLITQPYLPSWMVPF